MININTSVQQMSYMGMSGFSAMQNVAPAQAPQAGSAPSAGNGVTMDFSAGASNPLRSVFDKLSQIGASQSQVAMGQNFASQMGSLFQGVQMGLNMQDGPGAGAGSIVDEFQQMLQFVMENFTLEGIEIAQQGGTTVVVFDIAEIPNGPTDSAGDATTSGQNGGLAEFANQIAKSDATTQEGFDGARSAAEGGSAASEKMMQKLDQIMDELKKQEELLKKLIEEMAKQAGMGNISNPDEMVAKMLSEDLADKLGEDKSPIRATGQSASDPAASPAGNGGSGDAAALARGADGSGKESGSAS